MFCLFKKLISCHRPTPSTLPAVKVGVGRHGRNISVGSTGEVRAGRDSELPFRSWKRGSQIPRLHIDEAPTAPTANRIHCNIGVIEIKTFSRPEETDVEKGNLSVNDALEQAVDYASRLSDSPFSLREQNSIFIATYVVYTQESP